MLQGDVEYRVPSRIVSGEGGRMSQSDWFVNGLVEAHRPIVERDTLSIDDRSYFSRCRVCDGGRWHRFIQGVDEIRECKFWTEAKLRGLTK